MLGSERQGGLQEIIAEVAAAGYAGIEISNHVLGDYIDRPLEVKAMLDEHGMRLAAVAFSTPSGFTDAESFEADLESVKRLLGFLSHFPEAVLGLAGANSPSQELPYKKIDQALLFYHAVGRLARTIGVHVNVHPHSHHGSLLETAESYSYLMERLDAEIALGPDSGHIVRGGQDLVQCVRKYAERIGHIHFWSIRCSNLKIRDT
ncbi:sugar phosphate isomerase/epimerase family protein [Paenibacillus cymbidii]|uniref:sugar phosphate isomerase/epimerase family protein n=1 Tax=Paenibacillus cymbidii TaxID=1639034 RepID=UPI001436AB64|nr:sugar phosphate isomerase/epimerase [Paenibacillus cymbidii]